ncbi:MAG TPA: hypothetical protein PLZ93_03665 [Nocardioides sp.]|uniref:hypothetical protein n=1 Tax=uncultured Nocardioides sp. TaxID=198441 RepID=UPI000ED67A54|nr:hypothetical protein [uncultured Nocardioides sp.]HCB04114.1 hypothetical protein [Nocardioides sp.]HRI94689.1 hypothetical protein [Nocardioides sp.]HRK46085.1 hypothetical protein [Nocardioides sp.]
MKKSLVGALVAVLISVLVSLTPSASAGTTGRSVPPPSLSGTFIIGDSTLFRVAPRLKVVEPDWHIDHQRGRPVSALRQRMAKYLRINPHPANFVMALGTNRCHFPEWSAARLRRAIAQVPAQTNVFLVMVVRAGSYQRDKDVTLRLYNRYSRHLAQTRPNTYIINWRRTVLADPTLDPVTGESELLVDGTHQTGDTHGQPPGPGVDTYVNLIVSKWNQVNR